MGGGNLEVTISLTTPSGIATKAGEAFGDGTKATELQYAIYDGTTCLYSTDGSLAAVTSPAPVYGSNGFTISNLNFIAGTTYQFIFWADSYGATSTPYAVDFAAKSVTIDYPSAGDDAADAFYLCKSVKVESQASINFTLTRPFAQLNVGTSDLAAAMALGFDAANAQISVETLVPTVLNIEDGTVSGDQTVTFTSGIPVKATSASLAAATDVPDFTVDGYKYLTMAYILEGGKRVEDCTITIDDQTHPAISVEVGNLPLQRNYRTNVYGALLTNPTEITVTIDPAFTPGGEYNEYQWKGEVKTPAFDPATQTWTITSAAELAYIAQQVNAGANTFAGQTIVLANDINLCNTPWTPIGLNPDTFAKTFKGTFDGAGKTVKNLKVDRGPAYEAAGLFGAVASGAVIKDFTVDGADVKNNASGLPYSTCGAAVVVGSGLYGFDSNPNPVITGVTVKNAKVQANRFVGGVVGYLQGNVASCAAENVELTTVVGEGYDNNFDTAAGYYDDNHTGIIVAYQSTGSLTDNTVKNSKITGPYHIGGLCGARNTANMTGNNIDGLEIVITDNSASAPNTVGEFIGWNLGGTVDPSNTAANVTIQRGGSTVNSAAAFTVALEAYEAAAADGDYVINLEDGNYGAGPFVVKQLEGKNLVIKALNAGGAQFTRTEAGDVIQIDGNGRFSSPETLVISGLAFELTSASGSAYGIQMPDTRPAHYNYAHNVTLQNCTFTGNTNGIAIGVESGAGPNKVTVKNCTATGLHSLGQVRGTDLVFDGCTVDCVRGINAQDSPATIINCNIKVEKYGVRVAQGPLNITGSTIYTSCVPSQADKDNNDVDGAVVIRYTATATTGIVVTNSNISAIEGGYCYVSKEQNLLSDVMIDGVALTLDGPSSWNFCDPYTWNGVYPTTRPAGFVQENGKWMIKDAAALAYLPLAVANDGVKKVYLAHDIDLDNNLWTPINVASVYYFEFNGQNHTIKNLNINNPSSKWDNPSNNGAALFQTNGGGDYMQVISNLTVENAVVVGGDQTAVVSSYGVDMTNVHVKNINVTGTKYVGGIAGRLYTCSVSNCTVSGTNNSVTASSSQVGGITGCSFIDGGGNVTIDNCYVANTTLSGTDEVGGIVGRAKTSGNYITVSNCSTTNVTINCSGRQGDFVGRDYDNEGHLTITSCTKN